MSIKIKEEPTRKKSILRSAAITILAMRGKWLFWIRRIHLYVSVFFAPLLLLFVITGWAQTEGFSGDLMNRLSEIHTRQYFPSMVTSPGTKGKWSIAGQTGTARGTKYAGQDTTWPTKWLVVAMCIALMTSISLGLILAFTVVRNRVPVWIALILGIVTPVLFLAWAHFE